MVSELWLRHLDLRAYLHLKPPKEFFFYHIAYLNLQIWDKKITQKFLYQGRAKNNLGTRLKTTFTSPSRAWNFRIEMYRDWNFGLFTLGFLRSSFTLGSSFTALPSRTMFDIPGHENSNSIRKNSKQKRKKKLPYSVSKSTNLGQENYTKISLPRSS